MATLETRVTALATAMGGDVKTINTTMGALAGLSTAVKTNLVAAINEVRTAALAGGVAINDTTPSGTSVYSSNKTISEIDSRISALVGGSVSALDTLQELAAALGNDASFASNIATQINNRVRFDSAQVLTAPQQAQALSNIGGIAASAIGNPDADLLAAYVAAKT